MFPRAVPDSRFVFSVTGTQPNATHFLVLVERDW
jgi:hypothetical protein